MTFRFSAVLVTLLAVNTAWGAQDVLQQKEAEARAQLITHVDMDFAVDLTSAENFIGEATLRFQVRENARGKADVPFVELNDAKIASVTLNDTPWQEIEIQDRYKNNRLRLPLGDLKAKNTLVIRYQRDYQHDGVGLHRFEDPADHTQYVYTHFEPYHAHWFVPCFDQPDLKVVFRGEVTAPKDWTVFHNSMEEKTEPAKDGAARKWTFKPTPRMSTYLLAVVAGPFQVWKSLAKVGENEVPLRLAARKSLAKYVNTAEWFQITRRGLDFFSLFFGIEYPFKKYDQILVPEFSMGAMENIAAVTFNEGYAFRSEPTEQQKEGRNDTILHEMAHQWFGNLVTMKWWNGLWLNESFATWASHRARAELSPGSDVWRQFYRSDKLGAYEADALETTHPVDQAAASTADAVASFDDITYGKGASALKQLAFLIGDDDFREGLQRYFTIFAYRNTQLADFFRKIGEASDQDLSAWSKDWLQTSGTDRLEAQWACDGDLIAHFAIKKEPATSRAHRTAVGLYGASRLAHIPWKLLRKPEPLVNGRRRKTAAQSDTPLPPYSFATTVRGAVTEVPEAMGFPCPTHVILNEEDHDFAATQWKAETLADFAAHPARVESALNRHRMWEDLWDAVETRTIPVETYLKAVTSQLPLEKDPEMVVSVLGNLASLRRVHLLFPGPLDYLTDPAARASWSKKLETWSRSQWQRHKAGSDLRKIWFQFALALATPASGKRWIAGFFEGKTPVGPTGIDWSSERQWNALFHLSRIGGHPKLDAWVERLSAADPSDFGVRGRWMVRAATPTLEVKAAIVDAWLGRQGELEHLSHFRAVAMALIPEDHPEFLSALQPRVLAQLVLWGSPTSDTQFEEFATVIAEEFITVRCDGTQGRILREFLSSHSDLKPAILKALREAAQKSERCSPPAAPTNTPGAV